MDLLRSVRDQLSDPTVRRVVIGLAALVVLLIVVKLIQRSTARVVDDPNTRYRARKVVGFSGYLVAIIILVSLFSDHLGQVSVLLGVAGAGVAFALQEVIASVAGWAVVSFGGFYKVGDRVELGGIKGDVIDIGPLRTTLAEVGAWVAGDLYNGRVVRIANSFIFKAPVHNYSGDFPFLWDEMTVPVRFGSDLPGTRALLLDAARAVCGSYAAEAARIWKEMQDRYRVEEASTDPMVTMVFDHNWVTFTIRYPVRYDLRRTTRDRLSAEILDAITASGGAVSIAASALELVPRASASVPPAPPP